MLTQRTKQQNKDNLIYIFLIEIRRYTQSKEAAILFKLLLFRKQLLCLFVYG